MKKSVFSFTNRITLSIIGTVIIAIGIALFRLSNLGIDPATAANIGISEKLNMNLGNYQLIFNLLLFLIIFMINRTFFGIGTIINMTFPGYIIDFIDMKFSQFNVHASLFWMQALFFLVSILLFSLGISIYTHADIGVSPYDAVALVLENYSISYRVSRSIQDILFVSIAFFFGGPIGVGTIIIALGSGIFIHFWRNLLKNIHEKESKY
ncbi:YczE/YyaS/YitT family protein [Lactococcus lactis]|uniref:YczE/YyaS/YitT family protein n=1 Tax=Lactococcus lactis TaxID=1358 RepID=UPI001F21D06F|nr:membrane protein [Lactococcus lactis]MCG1001712.1 membrane protein [Lactococcus lactis]